MPILEVSAPAKTARIFEINGITLTKLHLYATWVGRTIDEIVNEALQFIFREDAEFQNFLITERASEIHSHLQQHALRQIELRAKEFAEFLANDSDRSDDTLHKFRVTSDDFEPKRRAKRFTLSEPGCVTNGAAKVPIALPKAASEK